MIPEGLYCLDCHTAYLNRPDVPCTGNCDGDGPVSDEACVKRSREKRWGKGPDTHTGRYWTGGRNLHPRHKG